MDLITADRLLCKRDGLCATVCPMGTIVMDEAGYPRAAEGAPCIRCGHCLAVCPKGALRHAELSMEDCDPAPEKLPTLPELSGLMRFRRSVRLYKDRPVPRETLAGLLDIARHAPTAVNTQQVSYIVTADPAKTRALAAGVAEWMRANIHVRPYFARFVEEWDRGNDRILRGAPHVVVALADAQNDWGEVDCTIALSYLELAAAAAGLGVCWAGILQRALAGDPALAASLGVPPDKRPCGALMLGEPKHRYARIPPRNAAQVRWV